ncbi:hypothetical protein ACLBWX_01030 [Methylobacterium sp. M6A4_1b]
MCFGGGSKSTNNVNTPAYAATPEAGAGAIQQDSVASPQTTSKVPGLSDRPTQADMTGADRRTQGVGLNITRVPDGDLYIATGSAYYLLHG